MVCLIHKRSAWVFENGNRTDPLGVVAGPAISRTLAADKEVPHLDEAAEQVEEQEVRVVPGDLAHETVELVLPERMDSNAMKRKSA